MDKRTLRLRKGRPRNARPYDLQNQSIFGKVCSTVKGLLNPSWLFNVSHWIGNSEEQPEGSSDDIEEDTVREDNDVICQSSSHGSKRLRLRFDDNVPSIQSSGTQTWPEQSSQDLFESISCVQSPATQSSLLENKETITVLNGDDHSENSEGSASTSGCSSLVSSHKESNRLVENSFVNLLELKNSSRKRKLTSSKSGLSDLDSSRALWSSNFSPKFQRRLPTISHTNQPSFNLSTFVGPSKINESIEKKVSSPFYEGRTTFGGASASRRMPPSATLYQADRSAGNKIKVREHTSDDSLEGMSSAAKRILLTLEKMSTPVADAQRIPNSDTSPIDLSLYLTPPKSRRNSQFTPSVACKGPPIANINTIAKLATLKNYGASRLRDSLLSPSVSPLNSKIEKKTDLQPKPFISVTFSKPLEPELSNNTLPKENIPSSSPCDLKIEEKSDMLPKLFEFSSPIEHELPNNSLPKENIPLSTLDPKTEKKSDTQSKPFVFSKPIELELPNTNNTLPKENIPLPVNSSVSTGVSPLSTWECSSCWIRNPHSRTSCVACEAPQILKETSSALKFKTAEETKSNPVVSTSVSVTPTGFSFSIPAASSPAVFSFGTSKTESQNATPSKPLKFGLGKDNWDRFYPGRSDLSFLSQTVSTCSNTPTWECGACWVRNSETETKCIACETAHPQQENLPAKKINSTASCAFSTWECTSCWVRNPMKEKKCMACETLHPSADINTGAATSNKSTFQTTEAEKPTFKSGNQTSESTAPTVTKATVPSSTLAKSEACNQIPSSGSQNTVLADGSTTNNFVFGSKSDTSNQIPTTVSQSSGLAFGSPSNFTFSGKTGNTSTTSQITTPTFGSTTAVSCVFGNGSTQSSSGAEKPSNGALFNFGVTTSGSFQFGTSNKTLPVTTTAIANVSSSSTWECSSCWVQNPLDRTSCVACETPRVPKETSSSLKNKSAEETKSTPAVSTTASVSSTGFSFGNLASSPAVFTFGASKSENQTITSSKPFSFGLGSNASTWECSTCLIRNPETESKCKACEAARPTKENMNAKSISSTLSNVFSTWECTSCLVRNPMKEKKCMACETLHPNTDTSSGFTFKGFEKPQTSISLSSSTSQSATSGLVAGIASTAPSGGFVFRAPKTEAKNATAVPFPFGSGLEKSQTPSSVPSSTSQSATPGLNVGTSAPVPSGGFVFGTPKTEAQNTVPAPFSVGSGLEKPQSTPSVSSSTPQSTSSGLNIGTTAPVPSGGFVFGAPKTEAQNTAPFAFGSGATSSSNASAFSAFQPTQPANTSFKFGSQPQGSTALPAGTSSTFSFAKSDGSNQIPISGSQNPVSAFGSTPTNFVFGSKSDTSNQIPSTVSQSSGLQFGTSTNFTFSGKNENTNVASQNSTPTFGSSTMQSVFGSASVQSFGGTDKPVSGGFNFGVATPGVFQFGASSNNAEKKRSATASGFSFGAPAAPETNNSFSTGFNMNTPPSFNFGATSTPAGPFQFAASTAPKSAPAQNAPRKYRKALRRVPRKD